VEWKYQTATITLYPKTMRHLTPEEIENTVIHEIMHVFLNEMRAWSIDTDHEERCATQLQKAFSWVKNAKGKQ
jgi:predicted SprT family Zn-dependent metalloprotease